MKIGVVFQPKPFYPGPMRACSCPRCSANADPPESFHPLLREPIATLLFSASDEWAAARIADRYERVICRFLRAFRIPYFSPHQPEDHPTSSNEPIFDGFIFFSGKPNPTQPDPTRRLKGTADFLTLKASHILGINYTTNQAKLRAELRAIHSQKSTARIRLTSEDIPAHRSPVRVEAGPLAGLEGWFFPNPPSPYMIFNSDLTGYRIACPLNIEDLARSTPA
jgi:hypothetical protein